MNDSMFSRPRSLFDQLESVQRLLARSLGEDGQPGSIRSSGSGAFPEINVGRTESSVELFAFAPGIDPNSLEVSIERNVIKIAGERVRSVPEQAAQVQTYANERPAGRFSRAVSLPDDVDPLQVEATYRDGILRVSIALSAAAQPQRIVVK